MKKKELKKLAKEIANLETIIQIGSTEEIEIAKNKMITLSGKIGPEDMFLIDELVQEILEKELS